MEGLLGQAEELLDVAHAIQSLSLVISDACSRFWFGGQDHYEALYIPQRMKIYSLLQEESQKQKASSKADRSHDSETPRPHSEVHVAYALCSESHAPIWNEHLAARHPRENTGTPYTKSG